MRVPAERTSSAMLFERNDAMVVDAFRQGEFDYLEGVGEVPEANFFRAIAGKKILEKLAATYPSPLRKHDVPLWVYIASDISMRFHGEHHFAAFPYVVRTGGMLEAFGPQMGHKVTHPQTGDVTLVCEGFNDKNDYDRETPMILSRSEGGRTQLLTIAPGRLVELRVLTTRYQRFRRARARLGQIYRKMIALIDELEAARRQEP